MAKIITYTGSIDSNDYDPVLQDTPINFGFLYPFRSNKESIDTTSNKLENLKSKIMILLNTEVGEKYMDLNFGIELRKFIFEPITNNTKSLIMQEIRQKINKHFGSEVDINSIDITADDYYD
jgi:phage baseplate assembly protein W